MYLLISEIYTIDDICYMLKKKKKKKHKNKGTLIAITNNLPLNNET